MVNIDFNKGTISVGCPKCKRKIIKSTRNIKTGSKITCACGQSFSFTGDLAKAQASVDSLKRSLKNFGK